MMLEYGVVISREKILRPPPRPRPFDHRIDGDVAYPELFHFYCFSPAIADRNVAAGLPPFKSSRMSTAAVCAARESSYASRPDSVMSGHPRTSGAPTALK